MGKVVFIQMHMLFAGESKDIIARLLVSAAPRNSATGGFPLRHFLTCDSQSLLQDFLIDK